MTVKVKCAGDYIVTVIAPEEVRIQRIIERENATKQSVKAIMENQWSDVEKVKLSHFILDNNNLSQTKNQVKNIHQNILELIQ